MTALYKISGILMLLLLLACSSSKETQQAKSPATPKPEWVLQRPVSSQYYIGVGMAMKKYSPADYPNVAKRNAISDLASEIKVTVAGNSVLSQYENNDEFRETFSNNTKVTIQEDLEDFEVVGAWESSEEFWVYYRLSKAQYKEIKQRKINAAIEAGKAFLSKAENLKANNQYSAALTNYFKAFLEVEKYLDEDLRTEMNGTELYFAAEILNRVEKLLSEIEVKAVYPSGQNALKAIWGEEIDQDVLKFEITNSNAKALNGMELAFSSSRSRLNPSKAISNSNGIVGTSLKLNQGLNRREVKAQLVLNDFSDKVLKAYINKLNIPSAIFYIDVRSPQIQVESSEMSFGSPKEQNLATAFSSAISKEGLIPTKSGADYSVRINTDTKKGSVSNDFYSAFLNGELSIVRNQSSEVVFKYNLSEIKGVGLDYNSASRKAYEAATSEIERKAVWQFMEQLR